MYMRSIFIKSAEGTIGNKTCPPTFQQMHFSFSVSSCFTSCDLAQAGKTLREPSLRTSSINISFSQAPPVASAVLFFHKVAGILLENVFQRSYAICSAY